MLKLELYVGTIFSNQYKQVFSNTPLTVNDKSPLEKYLDTLTKKVINIDYVYKEKEGFLIFDYDLLSNVPYSTLNFNYMRVSCYDDNDVKLLERYCFINSIETKNELIIINYSEDIWHSYINSITGMLKSYLINSKVLTFPNMKNLSPYTLPVQYDGNNKIDIIDVCNINKNADGSTGSGKVNCIIEVQLTLLGEQGEITKRYSNFYLLRYLNSYDITFETLMSVLGVIIENSSSIECNYLGVNYHYEIGSIYAFPSSFLINVAGQSLYNITFSETGSTTLNNVVFRFIDNKQDFTSMVSGTISNNFKNLSFGTHVNQIELINNGTSIDYSILFVKSLSDIGIFLSVNNKIIDITEDFRIDYPVVAMNSQEMSLLRMSKEYKINKAKYSSEMRNAFFENMAYNDMSDLLAGNTVKSAGSIGGNNLFSLVGSAIFASANGVINQGKSASAVSRDFTLMDLNSKMRDNEIKMLKAPVYSSSKGSFIRSSSFVCCATGLVIYRINSDNDAYVSAIINETGFNTYEFISSLNEISFYNPKGFLDMNIKVNYIKFSGISVYGNFSQDIANQLNDIFNSGVKIWYDYLMGN